MHEPQWTAVFTSPGTDPADVVVTVCAVGGAGTVLWLALTVVLAVADELRMRRSPRRPVRLTPGVPAVVRRVVAVVVGLLLGSAALSANAAERGAAVTVPEVGWAVSAPVEPGWTTAPAVHHDPPPVVPAAPAPERTSGEGELVVHRGDSLWSLAEARCGPDATRGEVFAEQHRLYTANADVIGDDPDLLLPGQVLRLP
ncbi:LysM peptidoglycan-binding domain-containing protein [Kineococcus sp. SYSU DK003]|uniref:LysM peptidoglycan-binding domain-containing protein n=1 Tax=Kineococcus sp. SYSU DK003 TaxID=3383124 RepID=UPI003D7D1548